MVLSWSTTKAMLPMYGNSKMLLARDRINAVDAPSTPDATISP
jgi:hypothetical protein